MASLEREREGGDFGLVMDDETEVWIYKWSVEIVRPIHDVNQANHF